MDDADFLLGLKNDPEMRRFAVVTHKKIRQKDHIEWLKNHLHEIRIIGNKQGMVRISDDREVSINIAPQFRGKGLASKVLAQLSDGLWAKIVNGNVASMRLFLQNGFMITDYKEGYYVLKN
jgi:RimJ/RimL family protein N-acetyltransferase